MTPEDGFEPGLGHVPVLAGSAVDGLRIRPGGVYVDCTAGAGGHSALIAARLGETGRLIALDRDPAAVLRARARLNEFPQVTVLHRNYGELGAVLRERSIDAVDGVLMDAGLSSMQLDDPLRGFTFEREGPLDMRMDTSCGMTAETLLSSVSEQNLASILKMYGDVHPAKRIAAAIVRRRNEGRMRSTRDLADAVAEALEVTHKTPVETRTVFQAIRIAVNEELRWIETGLAQAIAVLAPGGRLVCITFHSGEDRIAKRLLQDASRRRRELLPDGRVKCVVPPLLTLITPRPIRPSAEEIDANPRAHSGRLRIAERLVPAGDMR
jgi:16S rRNA (cytosine1402-N4)-methyltransferase